MDQYSLLIGAAVTVVVEIIKRAAKSSTMATYALALIAAVVGGAVFVYVRGQAWLPAVLQILVVSQAIYALLLRQLPAPEAKKEGP